MEKLISKEVVDISVELHLFVVFIQLVFILKICKCLQNKCLNNIKILLGNLFFFFFSFDSLIQLVLTRKIF